MIAASGGEAAAGPGRIGSRQPAHPGHRPRLLGMLARFGAAAAGRGNSRSALGWTWPTPSQMIAVTCGFSFAKPLKVLAPKVP